METGITARQAGTSMQQHKPSPSLSKQKEIIKLLTNCGLRRNAPQNPESLVIYAQDLSNYDLDVIAVVLEKFGQDTPEDFKPIWPAVGVFLDLIRGHIRANRPTAEQASAKRWLEYIDKCKAEGTENPDEETLSRIAALNEKHSLKKPKEIETTYTQLACLGCGMVMPVAGNIRLWTSKELREQADLIEELELIAERNRSMPDLPLGDVVDEVTA